MPEPTTDPVMEAVERTPREWLGRLLDSSGCGCNKCLDIFEEIADEWALDRAELSRLRARVGELEAERNHALSVFADAAAENIQLRADNAALAVAARKYLYPFDERPIEPKNALAKAGAVLAKLDAEVPRG